MDKKGPVKSLSAQSVRLGARRDAMVRFEKWASESTELNLQPLPDFSGYKSPETQYIWQIWQDAAMTSKPRGYPRFWECIKHLFKDFSDYG